MNPNFLSAGVLLGEGTEKWKFEPFSLQSFNGEQEPGEEQSEGDEASAKQPQEKPSEHGGEQPEEGEGEHAGPEHQALEGVEANELSFLVGLDEEKYQGRDKSQIGKGAGNALVPVDLGSQWGLRRRSLRTRLSCPDGLRLRVFG